MWMGYTDWLSAPRIAAELDMDVKKVREWKSRKHDPLPVKYIGDNRKQWRVYRKELDAWLVRNEYLPPSPNA